MADDEPNLGARVDKLATSTQQLATAYEEENAKRDERIRWSQRAVRWAITVSCLALVGMIVAVSVAVSANRSANRAEAALTAYKADTQRVRINACNQSVTEKRDLASLEKDLERARRTQTPEAKALTKQFIDQFHITQAQLDRLTAEQLLSFDAKVNQKIRIRDCTVQGLADYLNGHGGYLPTPTTTTTATKP